MDTTLVFDHVWKRFRRGAVHDSLRDVIPALMRRLSGKQKPEMGERDFWALEDLSFEVKPGEVLGIIGGNGAGKSTTLKILNELMEPTRGRVQIRGKIGSLIEVSAGFHQDLTGRQNVFLQGSIMGMKKAEVLQKFDQIVDFAGVADFIDTPVKRYSSGMNARLGFSIAAHLEPDVLIIDEVLAVGDHAFQQRAFGKIKQMATGGIPVVLVSHQMDRIAELCTKAILLEKGKTKAIGTAAHCISMYLHPPSSDESVAQASQAGIRFDGMHSLNGLSVFSGDDLSLVVKGESTNEMHPAGWQWAFRVIRSDTGADIHSVLGGARDIPMPGRASFEYRLDLQMNVLPGNYYIEFFVWDADRNENALTGPRVYVEVFERLRHYGSAQLNSRWTSISVNRAPDLAERAPDMFPEAPERMIPQAEAAV